MITNYHLFYANTIRKNIQAKTYLNLRKTVTAPLVLRKHYTVACNSTTQNKSIQSKKVKKMRIHYVLWSAKSIPTVTTDLSRPAPAIVLWWDALGHNYRTIWRSDRTTTYEHYDCINSYRIIYKKNDNENVI